MEKLGINSVSLVFQVINYLVLLYFLKRFLYKPILAMLKTRADKIRQINDDQNKVRQELEDIQKKKDLEMAEVKRVAGNILEETKKQAEGEARQIMAASLQKSVAENEKYRRSLDQKNQEYKATLLGQFENTVLDLVGKIVGQSLPPNIKSSLMDKEIREFESKI